jgi:glycine betaine/proline transport system substrate-binding protein
MSALKRILILFVMVALVAGFAAANGQQGGGKGEVNLAYVEWARCVAITHSAQAILEKAGYNVTSRNVANAAMWQSVATGGSDAHLCAWLPVTHQAFYGDEGRFTDQVEKVDTNYDEARLGLVVPEYVDIDSVPELAENAEQFNKEIIGIDPGAGIMQAADKALKNDMSGLGVFNLLEGSGPTMTAALEKAINNEEPIVVTGWKPHWKFARWDLKILDDPEQIWGQAETIGTIVRQGLKEDNPQLYTFFSEMDWQSIESEVVGAVMLEIQEGADPVEAANRIVSRKLDLVNEALPEGVSVSR